MTTEKARTAATITMATMFGAGILKSTVVDRKFPSVQFFIAVGFTSILLGMSADLAPELAGPLAVLILTVVILEEVGPVIKNTMALDNLFTKG